MSRIVVRLFLCILLIVYMLFIWIQSSYFDPESIYIFSSKIKIEFLLVAGAAFELFHLFQFGILYFLLILAFLSFGKLSKQMELFAVMISLLYGLIDEIHQIFVPFRSFSISDLLKDAIGVMAVSWIIHKTYFTAKKTKLTLLLRKIEKLS